MTRTDDDPKSHADSPTSTEPTDEQSQSPGIANAISIYPILSVNFIGTLGFSIVLPFLVFLVTRWGGNALIYGIIGAAYSACQLIGAPILGRWSDIYGRRRILFLSQLGTLISWIIFLFAFFLPTSPLLTINSGLLGNFTLTLPLVVLFIARSLDGVTGGNVSVASAYLADITDVKDRSTAFGKMAVSANLGFIVGPVLAGLLGATALLELLPAIAAVGISLVATIIIYFKLPESRQCVLKSDPERLNMRKIFGQEHKECYEMKGAEKLSIRAIYRIKNIPLLMSIYFLVMLGFNFFYISFPVHAVQHLKWTVTDTGIFFSVMGVLMVVVQGPVLNRLAKLCSERVLVAAGSIILSMSFLFFVSPKFWLIYTGVLLLALGNGLMWPSVLSILSKMSGDRYQGAVQGLAGSVGAVASIVGLILGGILFGMFDTMIFVLISAIVFVVFLIAFAVPSVRTEQG